MIGHIFTPEALTSSTFDWITEWKLPVQLGLVKYAING